VLATVAIAVLGCDTPAKTEQSSTEQIIPAPEATLLDIMKPTHKGVNELRRQQLLRRELLLKEVMNDPDRNSPELGRAYNELGKIYHSTGFSESAVNCYCNAIRLRPIDFEPAYFLALAYDELGDHQQTIEAGKAALALRPGSIPTLVLLGDTYLEEGRIEDAKDAFERAVTISPSCAKAWYGLGQIDLRLGNCGPAAEKLKQTLNYQPDANKVHYPLAMAYRCLGQFELAQTHLAQGGGIEPAVRDPLGNELRSSNVHALAKKGRQAIETGDSGEAIRLLELALDADSGDSTVRMNLAMALARVGRLDDALQHYTEVLRAEPGNYRVHYNAAKVFQMLGNDEEAENHLRIALNINPEHGGIHFSLGQILRSHGRVDEALQHLQATVELDPGHTKGRIALAMVLAHQGQCTSGVRWLDQGLTMFPDDVALKHVLARVAAVCPEQKIVDATDALDFALEVFSIEPTTETAATVAITFAAVGDFTEASNWQQRALELLPSNSPPDKTKRLQAGLSRYKAGTKAQLQW